MLSKNLNTSYKDHVTNEEDRSRTQDAAVVHDDLLTIVKKCKLRWSGHISRSSCMAKTVLQGPVKGARSRGTTKTRQHQRMNRNRGWKFPEGSERQGKFERYCCNVNCNSPTTTKVNRGLR